MIGYLEITIIATLLASLRPVVSEGQTHEEHRDHYSNIANDEIKPQIDRFNEGEYWKKYETNKDGLVFNQDIEPEEELWNRHHEYSSNQEHVNSEFNEESFNNVNRENTDPPQIVVREFRINPDNDEAKREELIENRTKLFGGTYRRHDLDVRVNQDFSLETPAGVIRELYTKEGIRVYHPINRTKRNEEQALEKLAELALKEKLGEHEQLEEYIKILTGTEDRTSNELNNGRVLNGLTESDHRLIINLHNDLRRLEGAADMENLRYNAKLADLAQRWSQKCAFEHGQVSFNAIEIGDTHIGQNLFATNDAKFKPVDAIKAWFNEKINYNYDSETCNQGKLCSHYTAVVWSTTKEIGCGVTFCPLIKDRLHFKYDIKNSHYIVCNYLPPGNYVGMRPYTKGPECTKCEKGKYYCNNGLCDSTCNSNSLTCECKAACKQCGTRTSDCRCKCQPGTSGLDCSDDCKDLHPLCGKNPGYPEQLCFGDPRYAHIKQRCPKLCKICEASDRKPVCKKQNSWMELTELLNRLLKKRDE